MANDQKVYLKQQKVRRGVAGYKNLGPNVEVVADPAEARAQDVKRSHHKSKDTDE